MKKGIAVLTTVVWAVMLWGCMDSVEIEDRNYVMAMGIDYDENEEEYIVSLSFPDLKALTGDGDNIHYPVMVISGKNLKDIEDIYHQMSSKRLDFGQLQAIVFGREVMENRSVLEVMISYMKNHQSFTRTIDVCLSETSASDIVALDESVNGSIGFYLHEMFENNGKAYHYETAMLNDLITAWADENESVKMAVVKTDGQMPKICGQIDISFAKDKGHLFK